MPELEINLIKQCQTHWIILKVDLKISFLEMAHKPIKSIYQTKATHALHRSIHVHHLYNFTNCDFCEAFYQTFDRHAEKAQC